jgi:hypothetical protein
MGILVLATLVAAIEPSYAQKLEKEKRSGSESAVSVRADVIWTKTAELTTENIADGRDLSGYEEGGYFDCRSWRPKDSPTGECDEETVRDFIWKHWTGKTKGYVRITYNSVDATSTSHIFVESGSDGKQRVTWRIVRAHAIPELNNKLDNIVGIISLEKVVVQPAKGKWALNFKNNLGNRLQTMPYFYK